MIIVPTVSDSRKYWTKASCACDCFKHRQAQRNHREELRIIDAICDPIYELCVFVLEGRSERTAAIGKMIKLASNTTLNKMRYLARSTSPSVRMGIRNCAAATAI